MQQWLYFLSDDPAVRAAQVVLLSLGGLAVYLVCYATRDILLRTRSFLYQAASILLVALLPVVGFFLYLLIRPARTIVERENAGRLHRVLTLLEESEILAEEDTEKPQPPPVSEPPSPPVVPPAAA